MTVIVTGSLGFDYIMNFPGKFVDRIMSDKIHKISLSFLVNKLNKNFGGTAGNIAFTLNLLKIKPLILSSAGNDFVPYKKFFKKHQISTEFIKVYKNDSTGAYFVVTDMSDNQIGSFYTGATRYNKNLSIKQIYSSLPNQSFIIIAPNDPQAMIKYVSECIDLKLPFMYDPAFQIDNFSTSQLLKAIKNCQILIGNDYEIALIEKKLQIKHQQLVKLAPITITTLGAKGSVIETNKEKFTIKPAKARNTLDPTGAGDAYRAGFLAGYLKKFDLKTCGQIGSIAAVYTVEKYGTQTHKFTIKEFCLRYKENYHKSFKISDVI